MIARKAILTYFKIQKQFSFMVTVGNKEIEFIGESIFGFHYKMIRKNEEVNLYLEELLRIDTTNLSCRELKENELFVLEQYKGTMKPIIVNSKQGEKKWAFC